MENTVCFSGKQNPRFGAEAKRFDILIKFFYADLEGKLCKYRVTGIFHGICKRFGAVIVRFPPAADLPAGKIKRSIADHGVPIYNSFLNTDCSSNRFKCRARLIGIRQRLIPPDRFAEDLDRFVRIPNPGIGVVSLRRSVRIVQIKIGIRSHCEYVSRVRLHYHDCAALRYMKLFNRFLQRLLHHILYRCVDRQYDVVAILRIKTRNFIVWQLVSRRVDCGDDSAGRSCQHTVKRNLDAAYQSLVILSGEADQVTRQIVIWIIPGRILINIDALNSFLLNPAFDLIAKLDLQFLGNQLITAL